MFLINNNLNNTNTNPQSKSNPNPYSFNSYIVNDHSVQFGRVRHFIFERIKRQVPIGRKKFDHVHFKFRSFLQTVLPTQAINGFIAFFSGFFVVVTIYPSLLWLVLFP